jgi:hypothetical protein
MALVVVNAVFFRNSIAMAALRNGLRFMTESYWLGKPSWFPKDMPDLTGKVVIVTGGNSGLGRDTVKVSLSNLSFGFSDEI